MREPDDPTAAAATRGVRARDVIWFNWPTFALSLAAAVGGFMAGTRSGLPRLLRRLALAGAAANAWGLASASLTAWWVFDRSGVTRWAWLPSVLPPNATAALNLTTGFDDTSAALGRVCPDLGWTTVDLFDPSIGHDGSIKRARAAWPPPAGAIGIATPALPVRSASVDVVTMLMSAHELRDEPSRASLFSEVARSLRPGGRLVLVEHLRNPTNALAFGPGVFHFLARDAWVAEAERAGLALVHEVPLTPFVRGFVFATRASEGPPA